MPINYERLMKLEIPEVRQTLTKRDTILFALGVGLGSDPCDPDQLKFVYEQTLQALPAMAIILGYPGPWHAQQDTGITRSQVVHGEQGFVIHRPLPVEGNIVGRTRIRAVIDKGKDKGALVFTECEVRAESGDEAICSLSSTTFCRADGGFGGPSGPLKPVVTLPSTPPDAACDLTTIPQLALIYRLSGDYNPLHADPAYAERSGFKMPILHGRCTFSIAAHAILKTMCNYETDRFRSMTCRFSSPVYPGETIRTEMWRNGNTILFRSAVPTRGVTVINNGLAEIEA
jgi:acyl dehydratase